MFLFSYILAAWKKMCRFFFFTGFVFSVYLNRRVQCGLNKNYYSLWYWSHNRVLGGGRSFQMLIAFSFTKLKCVAGASSFCIIPEVGIWKHKIQLVQILALTTFWTLSEFVGFGGFFFVKMISSYARTLNYFHLSCPAQSSVRYIYCFFKISASLLQAVLC